MNGGVMVTKKVNHDYNRLNQLNRSNGERPTQLLTTVQAAKKANTTPDGISCMRDNNKILAIKWDVGYLYPAFQFIDHLLRFIPDIINCIETNDPLLIWRDMVTPYEELDGRTPVDAMRHGEISSVYRHVL